MTKENTVKIGILFVLLSICGIIIFIVYLNKKEEPNNVVNNNPFSLADVTEYSSFFSVTNNINEYLKYNYNQNRDALFELLNKEFISANYITKDNVLNKLEIYQNIPTIKVKNMYYEKNDNVYLFYIIGDIVTASYDEVETIKENVTYFVFVDYDTMAFSIYPIYNEITEIPVDNKFQNILLNSYNGIQPSGIVTDNFICNLYYSDYLNKLNSNLENTYDLLEENFKNKNYKEKEKYVEFMREKLENISYEITSCSKNINQNKRVYKIKDANNNTFYLKEEKIMNYKVDFNLN